MEQRKPISHIAAGLIISGIMVVFILGLNMLGQSQNQALGWITYLLVIGALIFFIRQYGRAHDYRLTFGQLFSYGFKITSILTLIVIIFMVIMFSMFPEFKDKIMDAYRTALEDQGKINDDQIDSILGTMERNFVLVTAGGALLNYLILGLIGSLIGAAVTKKQPQNPFEQQRP
jgi:heme/copper-type cytochrome/quinol oxidase subunit 2